MASQGREIPNHDYIRRQLIGVKLTRLSADATTRRLDLSSSVAISGPDFRCADLRGSTFKKYPIFAMPPDVDLQQGGILFGDLYDDKFMCVATRKFSRTLKMSS
jgi:hypothetical protein